MERRLFLKNSINAAAGAFVVAEVGDHTGVAVADLDLDYLEQVGADPVALGLDVRQQRQHAVGLQHAGHPLEDADLGVLVEIDQDVAAEDEIEIAILHHVLAIDQIGPRELDGVPQSLVDLAVAAGNRPEIAADNIAG